MQVPTNLDALDRGAQRRVGPWGYVHLNIELAVAARNEMAKLDGDT